VLSAGGKSMGRDHRRRHHRHHRRRHQVRRRLVWRPSQGKPAHQAAPGAIIRISKDGKGNWAITQVPQVAAAFVAIDADTGAYHALVGGFDYNLQKFNHVTQAWRQPGSGHEALRLFGRARKGLLAGHPILDAPLDMLGEDAGKTGRRRTTTSSSTARSPCAMRWRNRRTCRRCACCAR
jgi:membrane carboxypeptidase/penicillin-binding protein